MDEFRLKLFVFIYELVLIVMIIVIMMIAVVRIFIVFLGKSNIKKKLHRQ